MSFQEIILQNWYWFVFIAFVFGYVIGDIKRFKIKIR